MKSPFIIALALALLVGATGETLRVPKTLSAGSRRQIEAPNFAAYDEAQCDESGNLFFHLANGSPDNSEILEIARDGRSGAAFRLPSDFAGSTYFNSFFVSSDGSVYVAVQEGSGNTLVFSFDSSGKAGDPTRLDAPIHLEIQDFTVFNDGSVLLSGYFNDHADAKLRGQKFAAVFAPSGRVRKLLQQGTLGSVELKNVKGYIPDGASALGTDGNAYLLGSDEILVLSPSGEVVRRLKFKKPDPDAAVTRFNESKGLIAMVFSKVDKRNRVQRQYLVLSASSGDVLGWYQPGDDTGNLDVCFTAADGFIFKQSDDAGKVVLITAPLP